MMLAGLNLTVFGQNTDDPYITVPDDVVFIIYLLQKIPKEIAIIKILFIHLTDQQLFELDLYFYK